MTQKFFSIYIGSEKTRICEITKKSNKHVILNNATEIKTPEGCWDDGRIRNPAPLAAELKKCIYGKKYATTKLIFTIASKKIANKEIFMPFMNNKKKMQEILNTNASEYFPIGNIEDYVYAFSPLENVVTDGKKQQRVYAIAAPKEIVESYYQLADEMKMPIENIDFFGNSVLQLLSLQMKTGTELVIQIERDSTFVNIMSGNTLILQRSIPFGKDTVISALMDMTRLTEHEVRKLLKNKAMLESQIDMGEYYDIMRYLVNGIERVIEYHASRTQDSKIDAIKVFGEGSAIAGIDELLEKELGHEVSYFEELSGVSLKNNAYMTAYEVQRYLSNLGAVLNPAGLLLKHGKAKERENKELFRYLYIGLGASAIVSAAASGFTVFHYITKQNEKSSLEKKVSDLAEIEGIYRAYLTETEIYQMIEDFYVTTKNPNENLYELVQELEKRMPEGVGLKSISVNSGSVLCSGEAPGKTEIAELIVQLKECKYIDNVFVTTVKDTYDEFGTATSAFDLNCILHDAPAAEPENEKAEGGEVNDIAAE